MSGQQIIIRKKKGGGGHAAHHGGAWKVAFADFMTAMMAFFLVMWILGLSESTRKSIAGYFREPGLFSNLTGKGNPMVVDDVTESLHRGDGSGSTNEASKSDIFNIGPAPGSDDKEEQKKLSPDQKMARQVAQDLRQLAEKSPALRVILGSVTLQITGEGVRIELADNRMAAYFDVGSARPNPPAEQVLRTLAESLGKMPNKIEVEGHTDGRPFWRGSGYTNWELSADRANAVRKLLVEGGVSEKRIAGISGLAATQPRVAGQPLDVSNRRVALLLRHIMGSAPTDLVLKDKLAKTAEAHAVPAVAPVVAPVAGHDIGHDAPKEPAHGKTPEKTLEKPSAKPAERFQPISDKELHNANH